MKILLMPNMDKPNARECSKQVIKRLCELEIEVLVCDRYANSLAGENVMFLEFFKALDDCDILITVGGDGTILHSTKHAVEVNKPLLGINVGRLGFMAGLEEFELSSLSRLKSGDFTVQERMLLSCIHYRQDGEITIYTALNDLVVSNGALSRMIELEVSCGGKPLTSTRADGLIFSTPTGSTAYALSAGGPVISPVVNCISLTPICPHSLFNRTVIFKDTDILTVRCAKGNRHTVYLTADGEDGAILNEGEYVEVKRSEKKAKLISLSDKSFYEILGDKFRL